MVQRPGGGLAARPLHFIWICDCSGSMSVDGKIQTLNTAIREAVPHMRNVASDNPNAHVLVRAVRFSSGAQWHVPDPMPLDSFEWPDLKAEGVTDMGRALHLVAGQLQMPPMPERALPPVLVLVTDGQPTDDYLSGVRAIQAQPWGRKAVRLAIAIGEDADPECMENFIGNPEIRPLRANNPEALVDYIQWVSTVVLSAASAPASRTDDLPPGSNVPLPPPPRVDDGPAGADDVW